MLKSYHSVNYDLQFSHTQSDQSLKILQDPFNQYGLLDRCILPPILLNFISFFAFQYLIYFNASLGLMQGLDMTISDLNWIWIGYYLIMTVTCFPLMAGAIGASRNIKLHLLIANITLTILLFVLVFATNSTYFGIVVGLVAIAHAVLLPLNIFYLTKLYPKRALEKRLMFVWGVAVTASLGLTPLVTYGLKQANLGSRYLTGYRVNYLVLFFLQLVTLILTHFLLPTSVYQLKELTHLNLKKLTQQLKYDFINLNFNFKFSPRQLLAEFAKLPLYAIFVLAFIVEWLIKVSFFWQWGFMTASSIYGALTAAPCFAIGIAFTVIGCAVAAVGTRFNARINMLLVLVLLSFVAFHIVAFVGPSYHAAHLGLNVVQFAANWATKALLVNVAVVNSLGNHQTIVTLAIMMTAFYGVNFLSMFAWFPGEFAEVGAVYPLFLAFYLIALFVLLGVKLAWTQFNHTTHVAEQDPFTSYKFNLDQLDTLGFRYLI